ncbi:MAG: hypothetical protein AAGC95_13890, partial [Pseudomonadota bacterium]
KPQKARKAPSTHRRNGGVKAEKLAAHNENATPKADFFNTIRQEQTLAVNYCYFKDCLGVQLLMFLFAPYTQPATYPAINAGTANMNANNPEPMRPTIAKVLAYCFFDPQLGMKNLSTKTAPILPTTSE